MRNTEKVEEEMNMDLNLVQKEDRDFVSRNEFIRMTGVFVSPEIFSYIENEFNESDLDEYCFIEAWYDTHQAEFVELSLVNEEIKVMIDDYSLIMPVMDNFSMEDKLCINGKGSVSPTKIINSCTEHAYTVRLKNEELHNLLNTCKEVIEPLKLQLELYSNLVELYSSQIDNFVDEEVSIQIGLLTNQLLLNSQRMKEICNLMGN